MTDIEISKALALAIGWTDRRTQDHGTDSIWVLRPDTCSWVRFDYHDWAVAGPIAERYECFPTRYGSEWRAYDGYLSHYANTPQKAIAMAVIGAKK